jgi:hypothetical protein
MAVKALEAGVSEAKLAKVLYTKSQSKSHHSMFRGGLEKLEAEIDPAG